MRPNAYPEGGFDWYSPDKVTPVDAHLQAQKAEQYTHDLMDFRADIWRTLAEKSVLVEGEGWAIFRLSDDDGSVAVADCREVMIIHTLSRLDHVFSGSAACVRIILKEQIEDADEKVHYITEDMMFDINNHAVYSIDALTYQFDGDTLELEDRFKGKPTPMFESYRDGAYTTYKSFPEIPVRQILADQNGQRKIIPFGWYRDYDDRHYALDKAKAILDEIRDREPLYQSAERS